MIVAVTGGSGQLGLPVLRRLLADRKIKQVRCLDVRPPLLPLGRRLAYIPTDVRDPTIGRHLEGADVVIHLAFIILARMPRPEFDAINVAGSQNVFEAAARAGVRRIIYTSSIAAYGVVPGHPVPLLETSPRRRDDQLPYAAAKYDVEAFLDEFEGRHPAITVVRLRPGILVGDRMEHPLGSALRLGILPDSGLPMPVVWDEDVADATVRALGDGARGAYNLVADDPLPARDLARASGLRLVRSPPFAIVAALRLLQKNIDAAWVRRRPGVVLVASTEKARRELAWSPRHGTSVAVFSHLRAHAPRHLDPRLQVFFALIGVAARFRPPMEEARHVVAHILLELGGPRGGDLTIAVDQGRVSVTRGAPRPPTSVVRVSVDDFQLLLAGALDFSTAQLTGKVLVEGDPVAALVIGGLVANTRAFRERRGVAGLAFRRFTRWMVHPPEVAT